MRKYLLFTFFICYSVLNAQNLHTITSPGMFFSPDTVSANIGDTIIFNLTGFHNAVEVSETTYLANVIGTNTGFFYASTSMGGNGVDTFIVDSVMTHYYICEPHITLNPPMKGVIIVDPLLIPGCTDSLSCNYNILATVDDGSCILPDGCTDSLALNYDSTAQCDDGSCLYCTDNQLTVIVGGGAADNEIGWSFVELGGSWASASGSSGSNSVCIADNCYIFNMYDSGGDGWNGAVYTVYDSLGTILATGTLISGSFDKDTIQIGSSIACIFPGCTDSIALNYNPNANTDDSSCVYTLVPTANLFFSEYAEGSSYNKYFEIYNPTNDTVNLDNYAYPMVNNNPGFGPGIYEYWRNFDSGSVILPNDVFVVAHTDADSSILIEADMIVTGNSSLSNGNDGMALVYGTEPANPISPNDTVYVVLDWIGTWDGDYINNTGSSNDGWDVAGVSVATANHSLIRKCDVLEGDTLWYNSSGTNALDAQWIVLPNDDWSNIGQHNISPCNIIYACTDTLACNYDSLAIIDDGSCVYPGQAYQNTITICDGDSALIGGVYYSQSVSFVDSLTSVFGCDSIVYTDLIIYSQFNPVFGGILNNTIGGGGFYSGSQYLALDIFKNSELVSAVIYSLDTVVETFTISDNNGILLYDTTYQIIPGGQRIHFNIPLIAGSTYQLGVDGNSNNLYRNNSGVNYPYNFGGLGSIVNSSAGGNFYYYYYDIEIRQTNLPNTYTICDGDSVVVNSNSYAISGLYIDSLLSADGCDSLVYTQLIVLPHVSYINNQTICSGEVYMINGNTYDSSGVYHDSLLTVAGCDSIVITNLNVLSISSVTSINNYSICFGDSIVVGTNIYYLSGTYIDTISTINGCDSIVTTHLNVQTSNYTSYFGGIIDTNAAPGAYSNYNGYLLLQANEAVLIKSANVYSVDTNIVRFELRDNNGIVLDAVSHIVYPGIQNLNFDFMMPAGMDYQLGIDGGNSGLYRSNAGTGNTLSYPFTSGPVTITSSVAGNQYYYFYYDIEFMPFNTYIDKYICEGDSIVVGGNSYYLPGSYTDSLLAANGCDSIVNTNLSYYQTPALTIATLPDPPEICLGDSAILEGSAGFVDYWWSDINGNIIIIDDRLVAYPSSDTWYLLTVKDSNNCVTKEDTWVYVDSCVSSFDDIVFNSQLILYPNPAKDRIHIILSNEAKWLRIYNMLGSLMKEIEVENLGREFDIVLEDWQEGNYNLQLYNIDGSVTNKTFTVIK